MEIHWRHVEEIRAEEREAIEERIRNLAEGHQDLIDVRITAKPSGHHKHGGQEVHIVCQARGRDLVVRRSREELGLALNEAMDAFEREVRRLRERRTDRRVDAPPAPPVLGIVERVFEEDGYGFILTDAGEQVYFHRNAVQGGLAFEGLSEGQRVGLNVEAGDEGPQANAVVAPPPDAGAP